MLNSVDVCQVVYFSSLDPVLSKLDCRVLHRVMCGWAQPLSPGGSIRRIVGCQLVLLCYILCAHVACVAVTFALLALLFACF